MKSYTVSICVIGAFSVCLSLSSCSKKANPAPQKQNNPVVAVYNANNHAAQYPTTGMVTDASGNLYITEGNSVAKINPAGVVTILAGSQATGSADGKGGAATFNIPTSLAIDAANNIYVTDGANNLVRKITPDGTVTTIAGSGSIGFANGVGKAASFNFPQGIAVDNNTGIIYIADTGNDLIRRITPDGTVSTLAGKMEAGNTNGAGTQATFNIPQGLAVDNAGNLFVADAKNNLIRKITTGGNVTTFAGSGNAVSFEGTGTGASLDFPNALSFGSDGYLYVTEAFGDQVGKVSADAKVIDVNTETIAFGGAAYVPPSGTSVGIPGLTLPNGIAFDSANNNVFVADYGNNLIRESAVN